MCLGESCSSLPEPKAAPWQVPEHFLVEKARAEIILKMHSLSMVLSDIDIDIPINFLFPGAHMPAAQPTARARAMLTCALVLCAALLSAALRRAALAEGSGRSPAAGGAWQVTGGHGRPRGARSARAAAQKGGAIARGHGRGWLPGLSQPRTRCESRGRGIGRAPCAARAVY